MKHTLDYDLISNMALKLAAYNTKLIEHCREPDYIIVIASEIHNTLLELTTLVPDGEVIADAMTKSVLSSLQTYKEVEMMPSIKSQGDA